MAIYGVVMNQAISMANLGANKLMTGFKSGQFLYSCSAIILVNPATGAAGLFHFPAGDIYDDVGSRMLIEAMIADVAPTECAVYYGTVNPRNFGIASTEPSEPGQTNDLVEWLRGKLGFAVTRVAAVRGSAEVAIVNGLAQIDHGSAEGVTDLEQVLRGTYPTLGYKIYWIEAAVSRSATPAPAATPPPLIRAATPPAPQPNAGPPPLVRRNTF